MTTATITRLTDGTIHEAATPEAWRAKRLTLLQREKDLNRLRDDLARQRRELPWVRLDKTYALEEATGPMTLADLFDGRSQLLVHYSCLVQIGRRDALVARSGPTTSAA